jgi:hypothetical protein
MNHRITGNLPGVLGLAGGIGNQFFLIAAVLAKAHTHNLTPFFRFDPLHVYQYQNDHRNSILAGLVFDQHADLSQFTTVSEKDLNPIFTSDTILEGYFQSPAFFHDYKDIIIDTLTLPSTPADVSLNQLRNKYPNRQIVGIQIRRGDYIQLGWQLDTQFYIRAMAHSPNAVFVISTDDPVWCQQHFPNIHILNLESDYDELITLSKLDGLIISQSTFGWWAAYLGDLKHVVAPTPWSIILNHRLDIHLEHWIREDRQ